MKSIADMLFYTLLRQEDLSLPSQRAQPSVNFYPPAAKDGSAQTKAKPRGQRKRPEQETAGTREERPLKRQEKRHSHHIQRNHSAIPAGIHPCGFHRIDQVLIPGSQQNQELLKAGRRQLSQYCVTDMAEPSKMVDNGPHFL